MSWILQFACHILEDYKSFQILLASEKLKDSQHSEDIFFQSTQHWIKWLPDWLILGVSKNLSAATSYKYQLFCYNFWKHSSCRPMLWSKAPGPRSSYAGIEVRSLPHTASLSFSIYTCVLGNMRLLWSKQPRQHPWNHHCKHHFKAYCQNHMLHFNDK